MPLAVHLRYSCSYIPAYHVIVSTVQNLHRKMETGEHREHETVNPWVVRARRILGPLMFSGGSIVGKSRHDRNVIMSILKLLA